MFPCFFCSGLWREGDLEDKRKTEKTNTAIKDEFYLCMIITAGVSICLASELLSSNDHILLFEQAVGSIERF